MRPPPPPRGGRAWSHPIVYLSRCLSRWNSLGIPLPSILWLAFCMLLWVQFSRKNGRWYMRLSWQGIGVESVERKGFSAGLNVHSVVRSGGSVLSCLGSREGFGDVIWGAMV
eukprot:jgi/Botrbrau1/3382/Bobra.0337s0023.1